jgi:hypothetical protein
VVKFTLADAMLSDTVPAIVTFARLPIEALPVTLPLAVIFGTVTYVSAGLTSRKKTGGPPALESSTPMITCAVIWPMLPLSAPLSESESPPSR